MYLGSTPERNGLDPQMPITSGPSWLCVLLIVRWAKFGKAGADAEDVGALEAHEVDGDKGDVLVRPGVAQHDGAGEQRVVHSSGRATGAVAGDPDGLRVAADGGGDVRIGEADLECGGCGGEREAECGEREFHRAQCSTESTVFP